MREDVRTEECSEWCLVKRTRPAIADFEDGQGDTSQVKAGKVVKHSLQVSRKEWVCPHFDFSSVRVASEL